MKETRILMGMPITVEIVGKADQSLIDKVYDYFHEVDKRFSTYKPTSEISEINEGKVSRNTWSKDMQEVFRLADETKKETHGYFDIYHDGKYDPSGIVKGWAIQHAAQILERAGEKNFFIDAGGDIAVKGNNQRGELWRVGIRNPFVKDQIVKVLAVTDCGVATSGMYIRGEHIYDPKKQKIPTGVASVTVIAKDVYDADRFATAAYAMGRKGIEFLETRAGLEGYMIDSDGIGTETSGFHQYVAAHR